MNLNQLGVQELNAKETEKTNGGLFWWFRISLGSSYSPSLREELSRTYAA